MSGILIVKQILIFEIKVSMAMSTLNSKFRRITKFQKGMSGFVMMPKFRKFVYIPAAMLSLDFSQDIILRVLGVYYLICIRNGWIKNSECN